jgi:hypothetical protein
MCRRRPTPIAIGVPPLAWSVALRGARRCALPWGRISVTLVCDAAAILADILGNLLLMPRGTRFADAIDGVAASAEVLWLWNATGWAIARRSSPAEC